MAFTRLTFSPVGSQSRRGNSPQQFSYISPDALTVIKAIGYFPNTGGANGMLGNFSPNDIISVVSDAPPDPVSGQTTAPKLDVIRIAGDGKGQGAATVATNSAGSGMAAGDLAKVIYTDGVVLRNTIIRINDATGSAVTLEDPGQFASLNAPTSLTALAYELLDGASGTEGTVDITITGNGPITVWTKDISEA